MEIRAQWTALRTFRRRARPLGQTAGGHPLFAVDSVPLTLPKGARHFHRVLACSRCHAEIVEWDKAVDRPQQLRAGTGERFCESCSKLPDALGGSAEGAVRPPFPSVGRRSSTS